THNKFRNLISMASTMQRTNSTAIVNEQQRSQLQTRQGPSLVIKPVSLTNWNITIPLLSPVDTSPTSSFDQSHVPTPQNKTEKPEEDEAIKKTPVFKKWKHPASPVSYEPTTFVLPFISV
ncbi:hypothetical protein CARUB_v10007627mg, partial [Capsella rubella]